MTSLANNIIVIDSWIFRSYHWPAKYYNQHLPCPAESMTYPHMHHRRPDPNNRRHIAPRREVLSAQAQCALMWPEGGLHWLTPAYYKLACNGLIRQRSITTCHLCSSMSYLRSLDKSTSHSQRSTTTVETCKTTCLDTKLTKCKED